MSGPRSTVLGHGRILAHAHLRCPGVPPVGRSPTGTQWGGGVFKAEAWISRRRATDRDMPAHFHRGTFTRRARSGAGERGPPPVPGDPFPVAADLAGTPAPAPPPGGVEVHEGAVVPRALPQRGPCDGVGEQLHGVPGDDGEQPGTPGRPRQLPDQTAVFPHHGDGRGRHAPGGRVDPRERTPHPAVPPPSSPRTKSPTSDRSSRKAAGQETSACPSGVPSGTSPAPVIHAHNAPTDSRCSPGCRVASRSRHTRPASNRSGYAGVPPPSAMCQSPPRQKPRADVRPRARTADGTTASRLLHSAWRGGGPEALVRGTGRPPRTGMRDAMVELRAAEPGPSGRS